MNKWLDVGDTFDVAEGKLTIGYISVDPQTGEPAVNYSVSAGMDLLYITTDRWKKFAGRYPQVIEQAAKS